jgi:hypothetical protein
MNPFADELARRMAALRVEQHRLYELAHQIRHPDIAEAGMHLEAAISDLDRVRSLLNAEEAM